MNRKKLEHKLTRRDIVKIIKNSIRIIFGIFLLMNYNMAHAQEKNDTNEGNAQGEVVTQLKPHSSDAIFNSAASYTFEVKNTYKNQESGKVSYVVMSETNKKLFSDSIRVKINANSSESYNFNIPSLISGFYKINFMINVSDYDDTTRRVFGIRPEQIRSAYPKPADFDDFWTKAKKELAKVKPGYKITEQPDREKGNRKVYLVEMKSLDNVTIRGWLTVPESKLKDKKYPVLLGLPGYQVTVAPLMGDDPDLAIFTINTRGQGLSKDEINVRRDDFITYHIDDKNKYVMRGVIMDCIRCMDFICSRPDFKHDDIVVSGGSMGGFLAIATAGLDKRVTMCSAQNPIMSDIYNLDQEVSWPINDMKKFVSIKPGLSFDEVLKNLQYYDSKNFATTITCPVLLGIGLLDPYVPPNCAYAVYNNIPAKSARKKIMVFKDLAHEVSIKYKDYEARWMADIFGLF